MDFGLGGLVICSARFRSNFTCSGSFLGTSWCRYGFGCYGCEPCWFGAGWPILERAVCLTEGCVLLACCEMSRHRPVVLGWVSSEDRVNYQL